MDAAVIIFFIAILYIIGASIRKWRHSTEETFEKDSNQLYAIANQLDQESEKAAHPGDVCDYPAFKRGVKYLNAASYSTQDLLSYYTGDNVYIAWMALEALARRVDDEDILKPLLAGLNIVSNYWTRYFALRTLDARYEDAIVGAVLVNVDDTWVEPIPMQTLKEFVSNRIKAGEKLHFGDWLTGVSEEQAGNIDKILKELGDELVKDLRDEIQEWRRTRVDFNFLRSVGRVLEPGERMDEIVVRHDQLANCVATLEATLLKEPPRSVILVGESGVGKSVVLQILASGLQKKGWIIFEAGGVDILSGQVYIGELEGRLQVLTQNITNKRKILWIVPDFHDLLWAGRHRYNPTGVLDYILPYIESGQMTVIGETRPAGYERLLQSRLKVATVFETYRISPLSYHAALDVARKWVQECGQANGPELASEQTLQEAAQLTQQYLGDKALPGSLLQFLKMTRRRLATGDGSPTTAISLDELIVTLTQLTGLPASILDDRQGLDLQVLRDFFNDRIHGQSEAIDCLVERVAMIKAGLTDPTRPQGVFLFVGPTGTGKTEVAKTLTEFLFGSPERMIRLDMSEFQEPESLDRIFGGQNEVAEDGSGALVRRIRNQPFSVVLLDEFEKAHLNVWDVFLQVFDDGRLTDRKGNTADFRHCIIILTSNLGANIPHGAGIGFAQDNVKFTPSSVERAVAQVFRKEFLNRLDRVVVFRPLGRGVMKEILYKELQQVLSRRGFRSRDWAVEWDDSAIDFLLDRGFTHDMGARPLRRAIERYLLSPLAMTIVNHQFPEGEQFLFVRSDGHKIEVEFIDPDAPDKEIAEVNGDERGKRAKDIHLEEIILDAHGTLDEVEFLQTGYDRLLAVVEEDRWQQGKQEALAQT
ncbi:MAG: AAA family ATPase, partial [bacterium]